jgi:hypothetical protein
LALKNYIGRKFFKGESPVKDTFKSEEFLGIIPDNLSKIYGFSGVYTETTN